MLVVKKNLLTNRVPTVPGGGTVSYVNPIEHDYLTDHAHREEGGTPAIIEAIRAGMVFGLKRAVGEDVIEAREHGLVKRAIASWSENPNIQVLGNLEAQRLSIVSFVIRSGQKVLHHNYVVALLNDLFGIQARGGCSCAGPYGHRLLGIDLAESMKYHQAVSHGSEGIKPGWVRVNFNYFISDRTFEFLLAAVHTIARHGRKLLHHYRFEPDTGLWRHRDYSPDASLSLHDVHYRDGHLAYHGASHLRAGILGAGLSRRGGADLRRGGVGGHRSRVGDRIARRDGNAAVVPGGGGRLDLGPVSEVLKNWAPTRGARFMDHQSSGPLHRRSHSDRRRCSNGFRTRGSPRRT